MKILVADPYPIMRYGLRHMLTALDEQAEVYETDSLNALLDAIPTAELWDLALVDPILADGKDASLIESVAEQLKGTPLVLYPIICKRQDLLQGLQRGATGFIPKWVSCEQFLEMISAVLAGLPCMPWSSLDDDPSNMYERVQQPLYISRIEGLTPRQREVLAYLAKGFTNAEIARRLEISAQTVRHHISAILDALNVSNRTQAALVAIQTIGSEGASSEFDSGGGSQDA